MDSGAPGAGKERANRAQARHGGFCRDHPSRTRGPVVAAYRRRRRRSGRAAESIALYRVGGREFRLLFPGVVRAARGHVRRAVRSPRPDRCGVAIGRDRGAGETTSDPPERAAHPSLSPPIVPVQNRAERHLLVQLVATADAARVLRPKECSNSG